MTGHEIYTISKYKHNEQEKLSPSELDYMEMIYRLSQSFGFTRVYDLAQALNVSTSTVIATVKKLAEKNLVSYKRYGVIMLKEDGAKLGKALLYRHNLIEDFLKLLNINEGSSPEAELTQ